MILGIQILGIVFSLIMIYLTFLYYKRKYYSKASLLLWTAVWLGALILVLFPQTIYGIMETLRIVLQRCHILPL